MQKENPHYERVKIIQRTTRRRRIFFQMNKKYVWCRKFPSNLSCITITLTERKVHVKLLPKGIHYYEYAKIADNFKLLLFKMSQTMVFVCILDTRLSSISFLIAPLSRDYGYNFNGYKSNLKPVTWNLFLENYTRFRSIVLWTLFTHFERGFTFSKVWPVVSIYHVQNLWMSMN